ncbi:MAG: tRNA uridine-5-carboxymethylaminomethyl(34) synthesis GTPase MnmE [Oscillospiraceae bacterium]|nr:tRNA uridine-5-carboxymethylaminomethyl(34) synthesis GTPase MnmE [Oscillospiraceae bacterium]
MSVIAAVATGGVKAALSVIRMSGEGCHELALRLFEPASGKAPRTGRASFGTLRSSDGRPIDTCVAVFSRAPKSYTGEDTVELSVHGSPVVTAAVLRELFELGARQAGPGEFTQRAFLNGKFDLTAAEAVADIVDARTETAARNAAAQLTGGLLARIREIYSDLTYLPAHFSALVDFPDEDVEPADEAEVLDALKKAELELGVLEASTERGRVLREGVPAALAGRVNAGKSSLLNALCGSDRAIVTDIPGTTRDTVETELTLGGVLLRLSDTAGLRETDDPVEKLGVARAEAAVCGAELLLAVFDGSAPACADDERVAALKAPRRIAVVNKCDLPASPEAFIPEGFDAVVRVSAKTGKGLEELSLAAAELFGASEPPNGEIITNLRQAEAVSRARAAVARAVEAAEAGVTPDAVLLDVEEGLGALAELTGASVRDDIVEQIFSRFCIGK